MLWFNNCNNITIDDVDLSWLRARGLVYPCACSRRDVELAAQAPHCPEPVYPNTCRDLDPSAVMARARSLGRGVSWRFRTEPDAAPRWPIASRKWSSARVTSAAPISAGPTW